MKHILRRTTLFIFCSLCFLLSASPILAATTIVSPGQSIQTAVNNAAAGDSILVRAGTYQVFTVTKNSLSIEGFPGERPLIAGGAGIRLSGSDITLSDFEVTGITAPKNAAILSTGNRNLIKNNLVHDNPASGTNGIIVSGSHNRVDSNIVYNNNRMGIGIYNGSGNSITKNTVYRNTMSAGDSDGIHCIGDTTGQSHDNTISENSTYENADDGIDTWNCTNNQVLNNVSHHNGGTGDGHGIKLGYGGGNIVKNNTSYSNFTCGFTSNGGANYYEGNIAYSNDYCGFTDSARVSGNTSTSTFINNYAYDNSPNYVKGNYTTVFTGNSQSPPPTITKSGLPAQAGDLNADGVVNLFDYNLVVSRFGNPYTLFDYNAVVVNFGT